MRYAVDLTAFQPRSLYPLGGDFAGSSPEGHTFAFNNYYLERDGRPFFAVSGEFHFSRMDPARWEDELIKMRMGGVNIVSTYLFWNHLEEEEGGFDFTGRRDVRRFVELCARHGLYVILRIGPFAHGEARNGGLPDWLYGKPFEVRSTSPGFLDCVRRLYGEIGKQVRGLFFRDGGPILAVQLDNEYMHAGAAWEITTGISNEWIPAGNEGDAYLLALRDIALSSGIVPAFFTATAWGGAACPSCMLPLWGGYAYRPWIFYSHRGEHPATEEYVYEDYCHDGKTYADDFAPAYDPESRPYACCEMGAGMMCCYYYRFVYPFKSVDALANIKLGSGCNFLGYYMFHGGTQPRGKRGEYMNEAQVAKISYDYQAALGEFGQLRESYRRLKTLHFFARFFGERLAPMETVLPDGASQIDPRDFQTLRFAVRTDGKSGFLFVNNFQDHLTLPARVHERVDIALPGETVSFDIGIASEENAILPFRMDLDGIRLRQANAQPVLRTTILGRILYVFITPEGMDGSLRFEESARVSLKSGAYPDARLYAVEKGSISFDLLLLSRPLADQMYLLKDGSLIFTEAALLEDEKGSLRLETDSAQNTLLCCPPDRLSASPACLRQPDRGPLGAYRADTQPREVPLDINPAEGHRWVIRLNEGDLEGLKDARLQVDYHGDIGLLYLNNTMIHDDFCNGGAWEIGLAEHREALKTHPLILTIKPVREGASIRAETAMAARSEDVSSLSAALKGVRVQPVYQIAL